MSLLIIYALAIIVILPTYLFWTGDLELSDFSDAIHFIVNGVEKRCEEADTKERTIEVEEDSVERTTRVILDKSLKHLDFITKLESYIESSDTSVLPSEFLQEFKKIKIEAQLSTLKTTSQINNGVTMAA